jgi:hypothetical protein
MLRKQSNEELSGQPGLNDVRLWDRPSDDIPEVPADITDLPDRALMSVFSRYVAWENFIAEELVRAEVEELRATNSLKIAEARFLSLFTSDKKSPTVTEAKSAAKLDPVVEAASDRLVMAYALRKVLSEQQGSLARTASFISRELSRRIGRDPVDRRNDRGTP